jgi:hypothetical protein
MDYLFIPTIYWIISLKNINTTTGILENKNKKILFLHRVRMDCFCLEFFFKLNSPGEWGYISMH